MATRRKFLKNAGILSAILALNPLKAEEISKLMHEILVEQPNNEFNEKH
jgi:hypothetical protein